MSLGRLAGTIRRQECRADDRRRRPWGGIGPCESCTGQRSGATASQKAFHSASVIRLSFIRSWRIAIDTNCALSPLALAIRTARHCSRVARAACNRCSESATRAVAGAELARSRRRDPGGRFIMPSTQRTTQQAMGLNRRSNKLHGSIAGGTTQFAENSRDTV